MLNQNPRMASRLSARELTLSAMFCALAYVSTVICHLSIMPAASFLTYDPKDIIITLGGLILGPLQALLITVVAALIEWFTISDTGIIGFFMNVLSSAAFACTASMFYHRRRTLQGAVIGLVTGCVLMTLVMVLWNYIITPMYMGVSRDVVASMLVPVFLPFNLIKGGLNAALTFLLYRPVIGVLRATKLLPASTHGNKQNHLLPFIVCGLVLVSCILVILSMQGIL